MNFSIFHILKKDFRLAWLYLAADDIKNWVRDAHLIVPRFEPDRRFSCAVTIDPFLVPATDAPAAK
jgi:hypothetical protein